MGRVGFFDHNGMQILLLDFSSCEIDQSFQIIDEAKDIIRSQDENSLRVLTNVTDAAFDTKLTDAMKEFAAHNKPYVKASAVVGITGLKKIIYDAVLMFSKRKISTFDNIESAKSWLTQD